jgi:hypothetical protein
MLSSLAVAVQGVGFAAAVLAVQGFYDVGSAAPTYRTRSSRRVDYTSGRDRIDLHLGTRRITRGAGDD